MKQRCAWARDVGPAYQHYHDREWGVPMHDDRSLFEMLILEGAQAGLSWSTILNKRQNYRRAYHNFDARKIARYGSNDVRRLMHDSGIVRNRLKIQASIANAQAFLQIQQEFGSFDRYIWQYVSGKPIQTYRRARSRIPARTRESDTMSRDLKKRGFKFVGSTICYAFMQATGMVNDHTMDCFRFRPLSPGKRRA